jgi:hypothetical protein
VKRIAPHANVRDTPVMPDYRRAWHPGGIFFVNQGVYPLDWARDAAAGSLAFED